MAPELFAQIPYSGFRVDMWALGITMFALLADTVPFRRATLRDPIFQIYAMVDERFCEHMFKARRGRALHPIPRLVQSVIDAMVRVRDVDRITAARVDSLFSEYRKYEIPNKKQKNTSPPPSPVSVVGSVC